MGDDQTRVFSVNYKKTLSVGIMVFLLSSLFVLLFFIDSMGTFNWAETWWAFKNSVLQSLFSTLFTLALGFVVALGLLRIPSKRFIISAFATILCLIPQFVPVVISLVGILNGLQPYPMGMIGIVIVHIFLNFGLAAVLIQNQMRAIWSETADVARTLGVSRFKYWFKVGLPQLKKDFLLMGVFFFSIFFTSFSVPLIVGGGRGTTLEVLIYEKMRLSSDWSGAAYLAWIQAFFILLLSILTWKSRAKTAQRQSELQWLGSYMGLAPLILIMTGFFAGYGSGLMEGFEQIANLEPFASELFWGTLGSLGIAFLTFIAIYHGFKLLAYLGSLPTYLDRFLNGYIAPSTALTCFGILIVMPAEDAWSYVKIPLAFLMLSLPSAYRLGWGEKLKNLESQILVSRTMGAGDKQIFKKVIWPQLKTDSRFISALVGTWACGDFAVGRILANNDFTIGLILETLLSSYRMSLASVVSLLLILLCLLFFFAIMGWDYVDRRITKD